MPTHPSIFLEWAQKKQKYPCMCLRSVFSYDFSEIMLLCFSESILIVFSNLHVKRLFLISMTSFTGMHSKGWLNLAIFFGESEVIYNLEIMSKLTQIATWQISTLENWDFLVPNLCYYPANSATHGTNFHGFFSACWLVAKCEHDKKKILLRLFSFFM